MCIRDSLTFVKLTAGPSPFGLEALELGFELHVQLLLPTGCLLLRMLTLVLLDDLPVVIVVYVPALLWKDVEPAMPSHQVLRSASVLRPHAAASAFPRTLR
eukprot:TRINITY_DN6444_c0_g1_i3.p1 TRINITY_DN6444_c0_g1~~TRINITY_DN6444_c0_g1_i3.p1  ORF type:complete len:101 (+),score=2.54 TRINITY_DN6444_c0_g1_i3:77-379(+)